MYAVYLNDGANMHELDVPPDGLFYVCMTKKGITARDHFYPQNGSSGSTLRRSPES